MPPKSAGKARASIKKGAAGATFYAVLPAEPPADAPRCLVVTVEVVPEPPPVQQSDLQVAATTASAAASAASGAGAAAAPDTSQQQQQQQARWLSGLYFRYRFLEGDSHVTHNLDTADPSPLWQRQGDPAPPTEAATTAAPATAAGATPPADQSQPQQQQPAQPQQLPSWRWTRRHQLPGGNDGEAALKLDAAPFINIILGDKTSKYLHCWLADLSCFLSADAACIRRGWRVQRGSKEAPSPPPSNNSSTAQLLSTSSATAPPAAGATVPPPLPPPRTQPDLPPGLRYLCISVAPAAPDAASVFGTDTLQRLNPMTIRIGSVAGLPSDVAASAEHLWPAYALCRPFAACPRALITPALQQQRNGGGRAVCDASATFLVGENVLPPAELRDWLEGSRLVVELHDRDAAPPPLAEQAAEVAAALASAAAAAAGAATPGSGGGGGGGGAAPPAATAAAPVIGDEAVDRGLLESQLARCAGAGEAYAHGLATLSLNAFQLAGPCPPALHLRGDVCPTKRRRPPRDDDDDDGSEGGAAAAAARKATQAPGRYMEAACSLGVHVSMGRPPMPYAETRPFTRAAFVFEYGNGALVSALCSALDEVNGAALRGSLASSGCSLRVYCLSADEAAAADAGTLDVVCGFAVVEEHCRIVVVEGLAEGGIATLLARVPRAARNGGAYRVLANPGGVRFPRRLYTCFGPDLKRIRLRAPLPHLCESPNVYSRVKVTAQCFAALDGLRQLRRARSLAAARDCALFPAAAHLLELESNYGEAISLEDMFGSSAVAPAASQAAAAGSPTTTGAAADPLDSATAVNAAEVAEVGAGTIGGGGVVVDFGEGTAVSRRRPREPYVPLDTTNASFLASMRSRVARDFLGTQRVEVRRVQRAYRDTRAQRQEELAEETVPTQWCYGPQRLNYTELKKAEMRARLARARGATFTYSKDFVSQTVSLVDETRMRQEAEAASRRAWLTPGGFVYPAPKPPAEYNVHPKRPSGSRVDMLREPWVENELHGVAGAQPHGLRRADCGGGGGGDAEGTLGRPEFDCVPTNGAMVFGGLAAPAYEKVFDGTALAKRRGRLPRGLTVAGYTPDPRFFTSVHVAGANVEAQREAAVDQERAHKQWLAKVVVEDLAFHVGGFNVRDRPTQTDRVKDILHGPPLKVALRRVRNAHLPSGRAVPFPTPPISALSLEPYVDPTAVHPRERARPASSGGITTVVGCDGGCPWGEEGGCGGLETRPPFATHIHCDRLKPRSQTIVAGRRKIVPLELGEKRGAIWRGAEGGGAPVAPATGE